MCPNRVFCSAFTPDGWVDLESDTPGTVLLSVPPCATPLSFWQRLLPSESAAAGEVFCDPFTPGWAEGFRLGNLLFLKTDGLHPRILRSSPFGGVYRSLYAGLSPLDSDTRKQGMRLLALREDELRQAQKALRRAKMLLGENLMLASDRLDIPRLERQAEELYAAYVRPFPASGTERTRFFSAAGGGALCINALRASVRHFVLLEDRYGAASRMLMLLLLRKARSENQTIVIGRCPLFWPDKIDHLKIGTALFTVGNRFHRLKAPYAEQCRCTALLLRPFTPSQNRRIAQNTRCAGDALFCARQLLRHCAGYNADLASLCRLELPRALRLRTSMTANSSVETYPMQG